MVVCGVVKYIRYINHMESYFKHLKTKRKSSSPFIGNMNVLKAKNGSEFTMNAFKFVMKRDTPLKGNIGPAYFIALDRPEDVKTILVSPACYDKPYEYSFLPLPLGIVTQRCKIFFKKIKIKKKYQFSYFIFSGCFMETVAKTYESNVQFEDFTIVFAHFQRTNEIFRKQHREWKGEYAVWCFTLYRDVHIRLHLLWVKHELSIDFSKRMKTMRSSIDQVPSWDWRSI